MVRNHSPAPETNESNKVDPFARIAFALIALSVPSIVVGRAIVGVLLGLALLFILASSARSKSWEGFRGLLRQPAAACVGLVALLWLSNLFESPDVLRSFTTELRTLVYILAAGFFYSFLEQHRSNQDYFLIPFFASAAIFYGLALVGLFGFTELVGFVRGHGWNEFNAARFLKETASTATIIAPVLVYSASRRKASWLVAMIALLVMMYGVIHLTQNRSAIAGLLGGGVVVSIVFLLRRKRKWGTVLGFLATIMMMIAALQINNSYMYGKDAYENASDLYVPYWLVDPPRQTIWEFSWNAGAENRWLGVGINAIDSLPNADEWNAVGTRNIPLHPHNWVVEIVVETGVVGLSAMLMLIAYVSWRLITEYIRFGDGAVLAALFVWGCYWTSSLFNYSYWSSWWLVSFFVTMAICLSLRSKTQVT